MAAFKDPTDAPSELQRLLLTCCPVSPHGTKSIRYLAAIFPLQRWSINKWIVNNRVPASRVKRLIEIGKMGEPEGSEGRVTLSDFHRFVYND